MEKYEISSLTMMMAMSNYYGRTQAEKASMNLPFLLHLQGDFDKERLCEALQSLLSTKIMNTYLTVEDGRFFANEKEYVKYEIEDEDVEGATLEEKLKKVADTAAEIAKVPLNLYDKNVRPYLFKIYNLQEDYHILYMLVHHTFLDFGSVMVALQAVFSKYEGGKVSFENSSEFSKFMTNEINFLATEEAAHEDKYWEEELKGKRIPDVAKIQIGVGDKKYPEEPLTIFDRDKLKELASKNKTSLFNIVMLIIHMAIARTNDMDDTVTQYAISNRTDDKSRYMLGCITRILTNRLQFDDDMTVADMNRLMRKKIGEGYQNRHVAGKTPLGSIPYVVANEDMDDLNATPLFNGKPFQLDFVPIEREMEFIATLIVPAGADKVAVMILTDMAKFGENALRYLDDLNLAYQFMLRYPDKTYGDFMRRDITVDTLELLDEEDGVEIIAI